MSAAADPVGSIELLVIDDDDVDRERVVRLLSRTGLNATAHEADSRDSALQMISEHHFDCVLLDNHLGDALGAELLPAIQLESRCPVIMITGAGNESLAVQALMDGASDYLTKFDLTAESLVKAIERAMRDHQMRLELDEMHRRLEQRVEEQAATIRQSERDLQAILDHTPTVIGYWDSNLRNRFGNQAFREWWGVDPQTLPGKHLLDLVGPERLELTMPRIQRVLLGEEQLFEQEFPSLDGESVRHAHVSFYPDVDENGAVKGFYSSVSDVSAFKRAQANAEELAMFSDALFERSPVGLGLLDTEFRFVMCNRELGRILGSNPEAVIDTALAGLTASGLQNLTDMALETLREGSPRRVDVDFRIERHHCVPSCVALARVERAGSPHLLLAAQDQTSERAAREALVHARDAAQQATRVKSAFLANISHEIRTPMNAIIGLTHLLIRQADEPHQLDRLRKIDDSAQHLLGLINDVLDLSKIEAGRFTLEEREFSTEAVISKAFEMVRSAADVKGLELILDTGRLPDRLRGDPTRLTQVLVNLLANAVKFTAQGWVRLGSELLAEQSDRVHIRFDVQDTGIGIACDRQAHLFTPFEQGDNSTTRQFGGTGLGLALARHLARLMGGDAGLESTLGEGSRFWFSAWLGRTPAIERVAEAVATKSLLALLVDDLPESLAGIGDRLQSLGLKVHSALSAQLALEIVKAEVDKGSAYDVFLIDHRMVPADGFQTLDGLRRLLGTQTFPKCVLVADYDDEDLRRKSRAAGFDAMLVKPISASALHDSLAMLFREGPACDALPKASPEAPESRLRLLHSGRRILLAEDNLTNQLVACELLSSAGLLVETAEDGQIAVAMAAARKYDLILMDMQMSRMDGLEATRIIRQQSSRTIPILAMTANAFTEDRDACLRAGMNDHVSKPVNAEVLYSTVLNWLPGGRYATDSSSFVSDFALAAPEASGSLNRRLMLVPGFEFAKVLECVGGSVSLAERIISMFVNKHRFGEPVLLQAVSDSTLIQWRDVCHTLRGSYALVGAAPFSRSVELFENELRAPTDLSALSSRAFCIHNDLQELVRKLSCAFS